MKFNSYEEYVEATKKHFEGKTLTIPADLMILPKSSFDRFGGVIEFGAGGKDLVNKPKCNGDCNCTVKCPNHVD